MKKVFCWIILTAILVATIFGANVITAMAQQANDIELSTESRVNGDTLTVIVKVEKNDGINILSFRVEYDQEALELVGRTKGAALASLSQGDNFDDEETPYVYPYRAIYTGTLKNDKSTGVLLTLRFRVKEGAVGQQKVSVVVREVGYMQAGKTDAPVYNEKYGEPASLSDPDAMLSGGVETTSATFEISSDGKVTVAEEQTVQNRNHAWIITLALLGAVLVVGGIILTVYLLKRKQTK